MLFARVFKGYLSKPMQILTHCCTRLLKPMLSCNERESERERVLLYAWVLSVCVIMCMLFARVFKGYLSKPMQVLTHCCTKLIKPMLLPQQQTSVAHFSRKMC